ncbi:MAG: zinc metalloprotease HtpX [Nitrospiraceae bacterium]|nr:zinc metalloprotease HtpX [Nitrospiraceae bacterium]
MALTFYDIEKQKTWRIGIFFVVLFFIYLGAIFALALAFVPFAMFINPSGMYNLITSGHIPTIIIFACIFSSVHFYFSASNAVQYVKNNIGAINPDPSDEIHKQLLNITDEIQIASGNKNKIECVVIPTLSMNALSAVDLKGNGVIAITEGLISRVSRAQLEAVMAHEAYHILSGDCQQATVAASLFGIPSAVIEKIQTLSENEKPVIASPAFLLAWILIKLGYLLNLFISRQREYRADAGAVKMTRNPLALAEVLHLLSRRWKGAGFISNGLEMLCISSPSTSPLDESEGFVADLLSTHPPISKRISVLLNMAHANISELEKTKKPSFEDKIKKSAGSMFYVLDNKYQWQGPFSLQEISELPWFSTLTWISPDGVTLTKASDNEVLNTVFKEKLRLENNPKTDYQCPVCHHNLVEKTYDKTTVYQCRFCGGSLMGDEKISRIIARGDGCYPDRIKLMSDILLKENQMRMMKKTNNKQPAELLSCPKCSKKMMRSFYSMAYLVELDRCALCRLTWFEADELKILQCMIENKMAGKPIKYNS